MDEELQGKKCDFTQFGAFLGVFGPLLGLWRRIEFCHKNFLQCTTRYENTICCKISEKSNGWLSGNSPGTCGQTDGWTHGRH